jgi:hypothetical protein
VYQNETVVANVIASPIFSPVPFSQGSGDTLQFVDAFQRANFWGKVSSHLSYHLKLTQSPQILQVPPLEVSLSDGEAKYEVQNGGCIGQINSAIWLQGQILIYISTLQQEGMLDPSDLPIFLTDDVLASLYPGFHGTTAPGAFNTQTYVWATLLLLPE